MTPDISKFREATRRFTEACQHVDAVTNLAESLRGDAAEGSGGIVMTVGKANVSIPVDLDTAIKAADSALTIARSDVLALSHAVKDEIAAIEKSMGGK